MTVRLVDPFLGYTGAGNKDELINEGGWASPASPAGGYNANAGPHGEGYFSVGGFVDYYMTHQFTACAGKVIAQWHVYLNFNTSGANLAFAEFRNNSYADLCLQLQMTPAGELEILDAAGNSVYVSTGVEHFPATTWVLIGVEAQIGSTAGTVRVWIDEYDPNGAPTVSLTGIDLDDGAGTGCDGWKLHGGEANRSALHSFTGFVGDTADTEFNRYLGNRYWRPFMPEDEGDLTEFTPSAGANWECVDDNIETNGDEDATYVEDPATAAIDLYEIEDTPADLHGIYYVIALASVKATGVGTPGDMSIRLRHVSDDSDGSALAVTTSYRRYWHGSKNVPGGTGWTKANVDALQIGYASDGSAGPLNRISRVFCAVFAYPDDYFPPDDCCNCGLNLMGMMT